MLVIVGDSGYPLEPYLMTPVGHPRTAGEHAYNNCHTKTRVVIEQTFGVLKSRFRCLHESGGSLQYDPIKSAHIAVACMLLHNNCIQRRVPLDEPLLDVADLHHGEEEREEDMQAGMARRRAFIEDVFL